MNLTKDISNREIIIGNRIPRNYFITKGVGESNITIHAGSYHLALKNAGIEVCNIMVYSSIMPGIANKVKKPDNFVHGEVMETISAVAHAEKGNRASAGIIIGWLYDKKTKKRYGGLVCEHNGEYSKSEINQKLRESLNELYINGFSRKFELKKITLNTETIIPKKKYGTVLVCIGFVDYLIPIKKV